MNKALQRIVPILLALVLVSIGLGQEPTAVKFAEVGNNKDLTVEFSKHLTAFIKTLKRKPKAVSGFITIAGEDLAVVSERQDIVSSILDKHPELKGRIDFTRRGFRYRPQWERSEFWLVPSGAKEPYTTLTADIFCPSIDVLGRTTVTNWKEILFFRVNVTTDSVRYKWSVRGGTIISGQGTESISVRIASSVRSEDGKGVTATVKLTGLPENGNCMDTATFTTFLQPMLNID